MCMRPPQRAHLGTQLSAWMAAAVVGVVRVEVELAAAPCCWVRGSSGWIALTTPVASLASSAAVPSSSPAGRKGSAGSCEWGRELRTERHDTTRRDTTTPRRRGGPPWVHPTRVSDVTHPQTRGTTLCTEPPPQWGRTSHTSHEPAPLVTRVSHLRRRRGAACGPAAPPPRRLARWWRRRRRHRRAGQRVALRVSGRKVRSPHAC